MAGELTTAPALSTPAEHLFEHVEPEAAPEEGQPVAKSDEDLRNIYEIGRTARELRAADRRCIALQFPDSMLGDGPRVAGLLSKELARLRQASQHDEQDQADESATQPTSDGASQTPTEAERIYILADTSYSACCVDEIAAEHANADVVVHYGRSCLSPTSRLPVVYVFTKHVLQHAHVLEAFEKDFPEKDTKTILVADVTYQDHVTTIYQSLRSKGYSALLSTELVRNPLGKIPNRNVLDKDGAEVLFDETDGLDLREYSIFHISSPPTSLLLALSSRVKTLNIYPTSISSSITDTSFAQTTRGILGRRYAKVLTLATAGVIGILVNTLSVANYLSSVDAIRRGIAAAGKKSYTVVVGKLNPAKLANFAEIDGWVVVGCWESSLVEEDAGYFRPVITPFELELALMSDDERIWGAEWWGGIEGISREDKAVEEPVSTERSRLEDNSIAQQTDVEDSGDIDEEESAPPEFDLRTGKLVSHSRPMLGTSTNKQVNGEAGQQQTNTQSSALALRGKSELATVNGVVSPGAEYLRSQRTWQGLGTDFDDEERSTTIEEGRSGVARGYTVGEDHDRR